MLRTTLLATLVFTGWITLHAREAEETGADSSVGLPAAYGDYLIASHSRSPDKQFAVIYPKLKLCEDDPKPGTPSPCQDYLVALKPFHILTKIDTRWPHFQNRSNSGISATWASGSSAVLVTIASKWGPGDIFLYEMGAGEVRRSTDLLAKVHDLLVPAFKKSKAEMYNDLFDFIFDTEEGGPVCEFADASRVRIKGTATTDPKNLPGLRAWDGKVQAIWDIPAARFTSAKTTTLFAGKRKGEDPQ